jgi:tRNA A37 threonylcarbamoyladenosine modification protein TsaB
MKLVLDLSTSRVVKVFLVENDQVVETLEGTSSLGLIDQILNKHNLKLADLEEVDSYQGPGSFTGLKIGAAIANTLNYTLGKSKRIKPTYLAKNEK